MWRVTPTYGSEGTGGRTWRAVKDGASGHARRRLETNWELIDPGTEISPPFMGPRISTGGQPFSSRERAAAPRPRGAARAPAPARVASVSSERSGRRTIEGPRDRAARRIARCVYDFEGGADARPETFEGGDRNLTGSPPGPRGCSGSPCARRRRPPRGPSRPRPRGRVSRGRGSRDPSRGSLRRPPPRRRLAGPGTR